MNKTWVIEPPDARAKALASELRIHPLLVSILLRRGLTNAADMLRFMNPALETLEDPFAYRDMRKAVDRVRRAIADKEKIIVYGDYDVDGVTGSAILYPVLKKMGADVDVHIPHRMKDGYGLNLETLKELRKTKFKLLITVDNGITGVEQVKYLNTEGVDSILVDHHLPKEGFPEAYAIISACVDDKGDPNLAACGLAFKFAWALTGSFKEVEPLLDLVAVGTIADIAPVLGDNRVLLKYGLPILSRTDRPGLRALFENAKISFGKVGYRDIAFGLGPRINASGRMGSPLDAFKLLTTDNAIEASNIARVLEEGNKDRQRVEGEAFEAALERVEQDRLFAGSKVLVVDDTDWHEGVLGIVAARLVERYHLPSVVISVKNGIGKGSGRSLPGISLFDHLSKCEDLFESFGGHSQACGLSIQKEKIPLFRRRLNEAFADSKMEAKAELRIDGEVTLAELDAAFIRDLEKMAPFGPGNEKPRFLTKNLKLKSAPRLLGKDTLALWVTDETGKAACEVIGFRSYARWSKGIKKPAWDIIHQPGLKTWNGITSISLELQDWR